MEGWVEESLAQGLLGYHFQNTHCVLSGVIGHPGPGLRFEHGSLVTVDLGCLFIPAAQT